MTPKEAREALHAAAALRFPSGRDPTGVKLPPQQRIEGLEDHYTTCAIQRGVLEEAQLYMQSAVKELEDQWDAIEGWQTLTGAEKTQKAVVAAKRQLKPDLYDGIREGKWLADKLRTQIRRLERDEEAASRLYSIMGAG